MSMSSCLPWLWREPVKESEEEHEAWQQWTEMFISGFVRVTQVPARAGREYQHIGVKIMTSNVVMLEGQIISVRTASY